jgi:acetylornithine deacetylase/succinyl-diaminopimelate desuccinylase-like protein
MDTFPVGDPQEWEHGGLYSRYNDGRRIHSRGRVNMKAGTVASTIAFSLLKKRKKALKGSVALTAVSDNETGGKWGTRYLLEQSGAASPWKDVSDWRGDCVLKRRTWRTPVHPLWREGSPETNLQSTDQRREWRV